MKTVYTISRILLGLALFAAGLNGFISIFNPPLLPFAPLFAERPEPELASGAPAAIVKV